MKAGGWQTVIWEGVILTRRATKAFHVERCGMLMAMVMVMVMAMVMVQVLWQREMMRWSDLAAILVVIV